MIFLRYSRTLIEANCYVIAHPLKKQALVVDPGAGSAQWVAEALAKRGLTLAAVLCTHGHIDHVWDSGMVAVDVPVFVPEPDLYRMDDPAAHSRMLEPTFIAGSGHGWVRPADVRALPEEFYVGGGGELVPGVTIRAIPAPGHTEGSTVFLLAGPIGADPEAAVVPEGAGSHVLMLAGDVIFRDGVGRTDLPGGDAEVAAASLRTICQVVDPSTVFFPGHGPASTIGREVSYSYVLQAAVSGRLQ